jgi:hypothetical protein
LAALAEAERILTESEFATNGCGLHWPVDLSGVEDVVEERQICSCLADALTAFVRTEVS